ncbi:hypothetical protein AMTRI_Chr03g45410 [Amborella trichopoda]|uniref:armadillo repeat-containing protein 8 n=1 Tax=Amborella trichopoda TaxID=13333 RepID=UPI0005D2E200|nr:armadillo repeat-containing protein 8 [Amborella trichopoda]|eukprot:XP_011621434.1 armadillo repeat-containing protein 8 [Amborella trichopoda]
MPSSAACKRPENLVEGLSSKDPGTRLKALRDLKNQIIGNRTKKLRYVKLGAVPLVSEMLESGSESVVLVQAIATLGSFGCGLDAGVEAIVKSGALPYLFSTLANPDEKVVEAGARSLRMIFQSKLTPKYNILEDKEMDFLFSLLNSENETVTELAASIIMHSCETTEEQKALCGSGVLDKLALLLEGSSNQRDASLDSLASVVKNNREVVSKFVGLHNGKVLSSVNGLTKDRSPRTRLLACSLLIALGRACPSQLQDIESKADLVRILVELVEEPGRAGDEAPRALGDLIEKSEEVQKLACSVNAVEKLCKFLHKGSIQAKPLAGILHALAELCSNLEDNRRLFLSLQGLPLVAEMLNHESVGVRIAACICIRNISRSVKNLSDGLTDKSIVIPLIHLFDDPSIEVQVAALGATSNILVHFTTHKSIVFECGGVKQLVKLSSSMVSELRVNAVSALRNLMFQADKMCKENIMLELTISTLASLICDPEPFVQEHALVLLRNLVNGNVDCINYVFAEDGLIINAVTRQVWNASSVGICIQGIYVLANIAAGDEFHKEEVMRILFPLPEDGRNQSILIKFLQDSSSPKLRVATLWCIINLSHLDSPGAVDRIARIRGAGITCAIKIMVNDPCLDVKFRAKMAMDQLMASGN